MTAKNIVMAAANITSLPTDANFISTLSNTSGDVDSDNEYYMKAKKCTTTNDIYVAGYTGILGPIIIKYDSEGRVSWVRRLSNSASSTSDLAIDSSDNVYVVGRYLNSTTSKDDIFLVKYDLNGNLIWQRTLASNFGSQPNGIDVDSSGNVYVIGTLYGESLSKILVVKWNSSGVLQWQKTLNIDGISDDRGVGIVVNKSNNSLINILANSVNDSNDVPSIIIATLLSSNGDYINVKRVSNNQSFEMLYAQAIDGDSEGNIYITHSIGLFIPLPIVSKYDSSLNLLWSKYYSREDYFGGGYSDYIAERDGSIYVLGTDFGLYHIGKFNSLGNVTWFISISRIFAASAISVTASDIYLTGFGDNSQSSQTYSGVLAKIPNDGSLVGTYGPYTFSEYPVEIGNVTIPHYTIPVIIQLDSNLLETAGSFSSSSISITPTLTVLG